MITTFLTLFLACGDKVTYTCTESEVLQECDGLGENCVDIEDCMADGLMCHAEMGHCMAMEDTGSTEDTSMNME